MEIEKSSPEPLYIQVQNWIKEKISTGIWKPNDKLPSEIDLAEMLGISRGTIKQAIKQLTEEGILTQIHGKGTYVVGGHLEYPLAERLVSLAETMIENHHDFSTQLISVERMAASRQQREILQLDEGEEVYVLLRLRYVGETPVVFLENYLPVRRFPGLEHKNFEENPLFAIIENDYGTSIEWGKRSFLANTADEHTAGKLQIDKGTPITLLEQTTYTKNDVPIEYSRVWIRNDKIKLTSILRRNKPV